MRGNINSLTRIMTHLEPKSARDDGVRNWPVTLTLGLTFLLAVTLVPVYGFMVGFSGWGPGPSSAFS